MTNRNLVDNNSTQAQLNSVELNPVKMNPIEAILSQYPVIILDGALATELEQHGCNLDDPLWSARVLLEQPEIIYQVHAEYFRAGADCAITSSYQASIEGFRQRGLTEEDSLALIKKTVELARQAREDVWAELDTDRKKRPFPLVAGSVGPYGAYLADGSEYVGHYQVSDQTLAEFHRPRMAALLEAGADVLAFETIPSLQEAQVLIQLLKEFPGAYAWLSFSLQDGTSISEGTSLTDCARLMADEPQLVAIGLNCAPMEVVTEAVTLLKQSSDKPVIIYPNSGETYDATTKTWSGHGSCGSMTEASEAWVAAGAQLVGGCCRTTPLQISNLAKKWRT